MRATLLFAGTMALTLAGCAGRTARPDGGTATMGGSVADLVTPDLTAGWPDRTRDAATAMEMKYGVPAQDGAGRLVWHDNGQWKRTVVYDDEVPHDFPAPHGDVVEQTIDYRVPAGRIDDLVLFHGSITVNRTAGELSVRCENEAMNFLALNLAHDIIIERRTAAQARREFARARDLWLSGQGTAYTDSIVFRIPQVETGDPDRSTRPGH